MKYNSISNANILSLPSDFTDGPRLVTLSMNRFPDVSLKDDV